MQAKQVAERDRRDREQGRWFNLYFNASKFYDFLDRFQKQYATLPEPLLSNREARKDFDELMFLIRRVHSVAAVFLKNRVTDELFASTAVFSNPQEALSPDRLRKISDAVESVRQMALIDPPVRD